MYDPLFKQTFEPLSYLFLHLQLYTSRLAALAGMQHEHFGKREGQIIVFLQIMQDLSVL